MRNTSLKTVGRYSVIQTDSNENRIIPVRNTANILLCCSYLKFNCKVILDRAELKKYNYKDISHLEVSSFSIFS
jgi:hypothetical protein